MADTTEFQAAMDSTLAGDIQRINDVPHIIVPPGYHVQSLETVMPSPRRLQGTTRAYDVKSFVALVNEFKGFSTKLFGAINPPAFTAVFNVNSAGTPGWGDHRATYACPFSSEWKTWSAQNQKGMNQADFAQFIEDNLPDLVDGATMLEVSRTLEAKKKVNFASGIRLHDGQNQFTYEEQIEGTAGKGQIKVPETFDLGIAVFEGGPLYKVEARLRYRITDGKLVLWYDLTRPHKILEDAVKAVWAEIEAQTTLTILNASI